MPKRPPMEIEFVASPRPDAEEKHKALLVLLARGMAEVQQTPAEHAQVAAPRHNASRRHN